ncbi:hypothetical protein CR513_51149, partial [Mucuna pruriens]
ELATLDVVYQPWCIQYPQLEPAQTYKLKSGLIHLLLKFHDPHKNLKEFHVVCSTIRPQGILEDYIKMKVFPFSLDGAMKDWLYLQLVLFNIRGDMKRMFLEKFFPASRTVTIRKEICRIRQHSRETLHKYCERFNKLCAICLHHQISEKLLIQYFYEGLTMMDRSMIDAANRGALMDKMLVAVKHLISNMVSNIQQFGTRGASQPRMVNEIGAVDNLRLENQLTKLTSLVRQLVVGQHQPSIAARVCGICTSMEHPTNMCPTLQETESDHLETVGAIGGYQYGKQPYQSRPFDNQQFGNQGPYAAQRFELALNIPQSQTGTIVPTTAITESASSRQLTIFGGFDEAISNKQPGVPANHELQQYAMPQQDKTVSLLFPTRTLSVRKPKLDEELLKMFWKVEINIPFLNAIKQIPKYVKFLKELCMDKRKKMKGGVEVGGIVSKCRDPEIFSIPCTIGDCTFVDAMLDLGASINVMPTSIYKSLNFSDLEPTRMTIQLSNRSVVQPLSVLEDVLVQVKELIFLADFYVLDVEDETLGKGSTLILGDRSS